jgi:hypothetical protein
MNYQQVHGAILKPRHDRYNAKSFLGTHGYEFRNLPKLAQVLETHNDLLRNAYLEQENKYTKDSLVRINDYGIARSPFVECPDILDICLDSSIIDIATDVFPHGFLLHNLRGISVRDLGLPASVQYHRDLPYQYFSTSRPIILTIIIPMANCLNIPILEILQGSHGQDFYEADQPAEVVAFKPNKLGDIVVMNGACYHRSASIRANLDYLVVIFTCPLILPCVDYGGLINGDQRLSCKNVVLSNSYLFKRFPKADEDNIYRISKLESGRSVGQP